MLYVLLVSLAMLALLRLAWPILSWVLFIILVVYVIGGFSHA